MEISRLRVDVGGACMFLCMLCMFAEKHTRRKPAWLSWFAGCVYVVYVFLFHGVNFRENIENIEYIE